MTTIHGEDDDLRGVDDNEIAENPFSSPEPEEDEDEGPSTSRRAVTENASQRSQPGQLSTSEAIELSDETSTTEEDRTSRMPALPGSRSRGRNGKDNPFADLPSTPPPSAASWQKVLANNSRVTKDPLGAATAESRFGELGDDGLPTDPVQRDRLALATRFSGLGDAARQEYADADDKGRGKMLNHLVEAEANDQLQGFKGKGADYKTARSAIIQRLEGNSIGIHDLVEFGGKPLDRVAAEKKAADDKTRDAKLGTGTYLALQGEHLRGAVYATAAALAGFTAAATDKANALSDEAGFAFDNSATDRREHVQSEFVASLRAASDYLSSKGAHINSDALDTYGSTAEHQAQAEWQNAKGIAQSAEAFISNPRVWVSEGAGLAPMFAAGGLSGAAVKGAGAVASWGLADAALAQAVRSGASTLGKVTAGGVTTATFAGMGLRAGDAVVDGMPQEQIEKTPGFQRAREALLAANPGRDADITPDVVRSTMKRAMASDTLLQHAAVAGLYLVTGGTSELFARSLGVGVAEKAVASSMGREAAKAGGVGFAQADLSTATATAGAERATQGQSDGNPFGLAAATLPHTLDENAVSQGLGNAFIGAAAGPIHELIARRGLPVDPVKTEVPQSPPSGDTARAQNTFGDQLLLPAPEGGPRGPQLEPGAERHQPIQLGHEFTDTQSPQASPADGNRPLSIFTDGMSDDAIYKFVTDPNSPIPDEVRQAAIEAKEKAQAGLDAHEHITPALRQLDAAVHESAKTALKGEKSPGADSEHTQDDDRDALAELQAAYSKAAEVPRTVAEVDSDIAAATTARDNAMRKLKAKDGKLQASPAYLEAVDKLKTLNDEKTELVRQRAEADAKPALDGAISTISKPAATEAKTDQLATRDKAVNPLFEGKPSALPDDVVEMEAKERHQKLPELLAKSFGDDEAGAALQYLFPNSRNNGLLQTKRGFADRLAQARENLQKGDVQPGDLGVRFADAVLREAGVGSRKPTGTMRFSLATPEELDVIGKKGGIAPSLLAKVVAQKVKSFATVGPDIRIFSSEDAVPEELAGDGIPKGAKAFTIMGGDRPQIGVIAKNLRNKRDAARTIEHEILGHVAVEHILGESLPLLHAKLLRAIEADPAVSDHFERVKQDYPLGDFTLQDQLNEVVARVSEGNGKLTQGARNVMYAVRDALASRGFESVLGVKSLFGNRLAKNSELDDLRHVLGTISDSYRRGKDVDLTDSLARGYSQTDQRVIGRDDESHVITPTAALERQRLFSDRLAYVHAFWRSMAHMGVSTKAAESELRSLGTKRSMELSYIQHELVKPIEDELANVAKASGMSYDQTRMLFDKHLQAAHAAEVNEFFRLSRSPLSDPALTEQRKGVVSSLIEGTIGAKEAREWLQDHITDAAISHESWRSDKIKKSGMSADDVQRVQDEIGRKGLTADFERINRDLVGPLRGYVKNKNVASGWYHKGLTDLAAYENYVPRKGKVYEKDAEDVRVSSPAAAKTERNALQESQRTMYGRGDMAEHSLTQLALEAAHAANRELNNGVVNRMKTAVERHGAKQDETTALNEMLPENSPDRATPQKKFGLTSEVRAPEYDGEFFRFHERPNAETQPGVFRAYDPKTGGHTDLHLQDQKLVEALSGLNKLQLGESRDALERNLGWSTRMLSQFWTSSSPLFWSRMLIRDGFHTIQTAMAEAKPDRNTKAGLAKGAVNALDAGLYAGKVIARGLASGLMNGDVGRLIRAEPGERRSVVEELRAGMNSLDGEAREFRSNLVEMYEKGGVLDYGTALARPDTFLQSNPLRSDWNVYGKWAEAGESIVTGLDTVRRLGLYMAMKRAGFSADEAAVRARSLQDFSLRPDYLEQSTLGARYVRSAISMLRASAVGNWSSFENRLWRNGEVPRTQYTAADGSIRETLSPDWQSHLNMPLALSLIGAGFAGVTLRTIQIGDDQAKRTAPESWFGSWLIGGEHPLQLTQQYGTTRLLSALGTALGLAAHGHADLSEIGRALAGQAMENTTPVGRVSIPEKPTMTNVTGSLLQAIAPAILKPLIQVGTNTNAFGSPVHPDNMRGNRFNSEVKFANTPQVWQDVATHWRELTGNDWFHPEDMKLLASELMPFGHLVDKVTTAATRAKDVSDFASRVGVVGVDYSSDSYESREARKLTDAHNDLTKQLAFSKSLDEKSGTRPGQVGANEKAFLSTHPEYLQVKQAEAGMAKRVKEIGKLKAKATEAGDADRAASLDYQVRELRGRYVTAAKAGNMSEMRRIANGH